MNTQIRPLFSHTSTLVLAATFAGAVACGRAVPNKNIAESAPPRSEHAALAMGGPVDASGEHIAASSPAPEAVAPAEYAAQKSAAQKVKRADGADDAREEEMPAPGDYQPGFNREAYDYLVENRFTSVATSPLSTFSVDVDTASYANVRRFLTSEQKPPAGSVRIEELINYFDYEYSGPEGDEPFSVHTELSQAPWAPEHSLLHVGLQGRRMESGELPPRNLVFLIDVSGSMADENKLPLLKRSLLALLDTLDEDDTVSIVVYAGASGLVLEPTRATNRARIQEALEALESGGSTNGGEGIELAYHAAAKNFRPEGVNRVILATDGDFNVGTTSESELVKLIEKKRELGVFLTVLGFGMGNYQDSTLEKLADKGNGNYAYIDTFQEAKKVLVEQGGANLVTIAKDVKIQIEMNPEVVGAYRLIGYENRVLATEDFNDDKKDAGEIGAGHTVTALYEILSPEQAAREVSVDQLRYQRTSSPKSSGQKTAKTERASGREAEAGGGELCTIKLRYKAPTGSTSRLVQVPVLAASVPLDRTSPAFRFSAAVAGFGMLLRDSEYAGRASYGMVGSLAEGALGRDKNGYRREFLGLVDRAQRVD